MKKLTEKQTTVLSGSDLKSLKGKIVYFSILGILILVCIGTLIPMLWIILTGFKENQEIYQSFSFFPKDISFGLIVDKVSAAWNELQLGRSMVNTLIYSFGCLIIQIVICGFGGFVLSKLKPKGATLVMMLVLWSMMLPAQIRTVPLYMSFMHFPFASGGGINILDTYLPLWIIAAAAPFDVLLFKNAFDAISPTIIEASRIDGCSDIQGFVKIMLPLITPTIMYVGIICMTTAWSSFLMPYLVLTDQSKMTTPVLTYIYSADVSLKMNTQMLGLLFASIPPFVLFTIFNKQIIGGLTAGAVKG